GRAGFHDGVERIGPGGADLAAFLAEAQGIWIVNPFQLSWQEPGALGKNIFGADRCRWVPLGAVRCLNREIVAAAIGTDRHHRDPRSGTGRHLRVMEYWSDGLLQEYWYGDNMVLMGTYGCDMFLYN